MTNEKIVQQVRDLLARSKSDNIHEATSCAGIAQKMMDKHSITEAMLVIKSADGETEEVESAEEGSLHRHHTDSMPSWKIDLGDAVTRANNCRVLLGYNYLTIIGAPSDADKAKYLFGYVAEEIDRLTEQEKRIQGSPGRTYLNNFRLGAVQAVAKRLREANREARKEAKQEANDGDTLGNGTALVLVNKALARIETRKDNADAWVAKHCVTKTGKPRKGKRRTASNYDGAARSAGRRAGESIDIGGQRAALGRGKAKQLQG
ncbi:MAG: DUF2786 domain-containing protein [Roseateles sp.]